MSNLEKVDRASALCICAESQGNVIHAEQCSGFKTNIRNLIDVSVTVDGSCEDIRLGKGLLGSNTISGSGCSVSLEGKDYYIDRLNILGGGKCDR